MTPVLDIDLFDFFRMCPRAQAVFDKEVAIYREDEERAREFSFDQVQSILKSYTPERLAAAMQDRRKAASTDT